MYTSEKVPKKYQYHDLHYAPFKKDASSGRLTRVLKIKSAFLDHQLFLVNDL
eukprot:SAG11_NODE_169_length_13635_cov_13.307993_3_plen_52_part_00